MQFLKTSAQKGSPGNPLGKRSKASHGLLLHTAGQSVGTESGDIAKPSETSRHFVSNTRPIAFGLKKGNLPQ
jgi:hypothetical protein